MGTEVTAAAGAPAAWSEAGGERRREALVVRAHARLEHEPDLTARRRQEPPPPLPLSRARRRGVRRRMGGARPI